MNLTCGQTMWTGNTIKQVLSIQTQIKILMLLNAVNVWLSGG